MSDLYQSYKTFSNNEFGEIRVLEIENEPWFVGKDIADALGYSNSSKAVSMHCKHIRKEVIETHSQNGNMVKTQTSLIPEGDIYRLIIKSQLPNAEKFESWVFDEVLPSIRKHGTYMTEDTIEKALTSPDFLIQLATKLKEEQEKSKQLEDKLEKNSKMLNQISASKNSLLVREVAKILSNHHGIVIGEKKLYQKLRDWGWIFKNSTEAKQEAIIHGYLEVREGTRESSKGVFTFHTTRVTGKGQRKILEKLLEELENK